MKSDFAVGKVVRDCSVPQMVIGFQSMAQFISFAAFALLGMGVLTGVEYLFDAQFLDGGVVAGALIGAMMSVYSVLPCKFSTGCSNTKHLCEALRSKLGVMGYRPCSGRNRYESKLPRLLRWEENFVEIREADNGAIQVRGAALPVRVLWRFLNKSHGKEFL